MSSPAPHSSQVKRLASLIAEHDGREGSTAAAEKFHQDHIEEAELSVEEISHFADLIEKANGNPQSEYSEKLLLSRFIAEGSQMKDVHFMMVISRCYEVITTISNHYVGGYEDYPVMNVQTIYKENLHPKAKWGKRLDSSVYDRMASILVALYFERSLNLGDACLLRVDVYREVISVLIANDTLLEKHMESIFLIVEGLVEVTATSPILRSIRKNVTITVDDIIRMAQLLDAHPTNLSRIMRFIQERKFIDLNALESYLMPAPALSVGGL